MRGVPPVVNDPASTDAACRRRSTASSAGTATVATPQSLGGEDFAWYLESVPGAMARLGTRTPGGPTYDLHQGDLVVDERADRDRRPGARRGRPARPCSRLDNESVASALRWRQVSPERVGWPPRPVPGWAPIGASHGRRHSE